jgi:cytochrome c oxidase cbb3-type subunit I/II
VDKMRALRSVGVPYDAKDLDSAAKDESAQAAEIVANLRADGVADANPSSELVALIAYLQRLGVHPQPGGPAVSLAQ